MMMKAKRQIAILNDIKKHQEEEEKLKEEEMRQKAKIEEEKEKLEREREANIDDEYHSDEDDS